MEGKQVVFLVSHLQDDKNVLFSNGEHDNEHKEVREWSNPSDLSRWCSFLDFFFSLPSRVHFYTGTLYITVLNWIEF